MRVSGGGAPAMATVAVAVKSAEGRGSQRAVRWAAENLMQKTDRLVLVHVMPTITSVPTPCMLASSISPLPPYLPHSSLCFRTHAKTRTGVCVCATYWRFNWNWLRKAVVTQLGLKMELTGVFLFFWWCMFELIIFRVYFLFLLVFMNSSIVCARARFGMAEP